MIASLEGDILSIEPDGIVIDVNGVGFSVRMSARDTAQLHAGSHERIITLMTVSRDALSLYGFLNPSSKKLFIQLQKVSGIGPRVAMAILSTLSAEELATAIRDNDVTALTRAPGLGRKGAQKIILELHGTIDFTNLDPDQEQAAGHDTEKQDHNMRQVILGLVSLGWQQRDAFGATKEAMKQLSLGEPLDAQDVPRVLRTALSDLDRGR